MSKHTITKTWLAGLLMILAGAVVSALITRRWLGDVASIIAGHHAYLLDDAFWAVMTFNVDAASSPRTASSSSWRRGSGRCSIATA